METMDSFIEISLPNREYIIKIIKANNPMIRKIHANDHTDHEGISN
jgi:hypothetical protein